MKKLLKYVAVIAVSFSAQPLFAKPPKVISDIAPVQGLVSMVMQGVGQPDLIIQQGSSPHDFAFRPSTAQALQNADIVFWIGQGLTPWLNDPITKIAQKAQVITLNDHGASLENAHDHDHDHGDIDPHMWLDPEIASGWLNVIAQALSVTDAENAALYAQNSQAAQSILAQLNTDLKALLGGASSTGHYIAFHDAYGYFVDHYGLDLVGAVQSSDAQKPSAARIFELNKILDTQNITCFFVEPQNTQRLLKTLQTQHDIPVAHLDALGAGLKLGVNFYPQLLRNIAQEIVDCSS